MIVIVVYRGDYGGRAERGGELGRRKGKREGGEHGWSGR
jgi:hypothetical protein